MGGSLVAEKLCGNFTEARRRAAEASAIRRELARDKDKQDPSLAARLEGDLARRGRGRRARDDAEQAHTQRNVTEVGEQRSPGGYGHPACWAPFVLLGV